MSKKLMAVLLIVMLCFSFSSCSKGSDEKANASAAVEETKTKKATLIVNGNLGDLGFFDSANRGMQRLKNELGIDIHVIETGDDESKWEPALADAADEPGDWIIAVSPSMVEPVEKLAPMYPEKKFILIDNTVSGSYDNVYCATFLQNEGSYLAGVAAGLQTTPGGTIGFIGGMDIPPINDFLVGYIEGARSVNPDIKVISTYTGDYYDPAKGKEHAIVQFNQGAEVIFAAAGPAGLGSIEAATKMDKLFIGCDSDQSAAYEANGDMDSANHIITSMIKNVGNAIFDTIKADLEGTLPWGTSRQLGVSAGGVGLAKNAVYEKSFTDEMKATIEEVESKIVSGEIKVSSAIGMSTAELDALRNSVKP